MNRQTLILASKSPRRRELLEKMGVSFEVMEADIDETEEGDPVRVVMGNALRKARKIQERCPERIILGADTIVCLDGQVFGKPHDAQDARRMLSALSGRWHEVYTGVSLLTPARAFTAYDRTNVHFVQIRREEMEAYIQSGEPFDKAGAYAIQGRAGMLIDRIEGSFSNVIGLPQTLVRDLLIQAETNL